MDPEALSSDVTALLSSSLARTGTALADEAIRRLPGAVSSLWQAIAERFSGKPAAEAAASDLTSSAEDEDNQAVFALQLRKMLRDDPVYAAQVAGLFEAAQRSVTITQEGAGAVAAGGSVAAGARGVAVARADQSTIQTGDKNVLVQVSITNKVNPDVMEPKTLASPQADAARKISRQPDTGNRSTESTSGAVMQVSRGQLEELRILQRELDAYVQGYVDSSREVPPRVEAALKELRECRTHTIDGVALSDDDWDRIKETLGGVEGFSLDLKAMRSDSESKNHQARFSTEVKAARQEIDRAAESPPHPEATRKVLQGAIDHIMNAKVTLQDISKDCHEGATDRLKEIKVLLDQIFRPYELTDEASRPTARKATKDRSRPPQAQAGPLQMASSLKTERN